MKPNATNMARLTCEGNAAEDALAALTVDSTDWEIASAAAEWTITRHLPPYKFSIGHDTGKRAAANLQRILKVQGSSPGLHQDIFKTGPCLLHYDWTYKNTVGIKTSDRDFALRWARDAIFFGYAVSIHQGGGWGYGCGGLRHIRQNMIEKSHVFSPARRRERDEIETKSGLVVVNAANVIPMRRKV